MGDPWDSCWPENDDLGLRNEQKAENIWIDLGPEMGDMKVYPEIAGSLVFNGENDQ